MILNYKIYKILESVYNTHKESKEYVIKKFQSSPTMKTSDQYRRENEDVYKYVYKQQLEKITKTIQSPNYTISYNIIISDGALNNIKDFEITSDDVLDYTEMALPYISKYMLSDPNFIYTREHLFYFEGESYGFCFVLNFKNPNVQISKRYEPTPEIDVVITRVTTPDDENGTIYIHNTNSHTKLNL